MGDINDHEIHGGVNHCSGNTETPCYRCASASVFIPWTTTNAAAIMSSIYILSQCFAIYPISGYNMRQNSLLDVRIKANLIQHDFFPQGGPSKTEGYSK